MQTEVHDLRDMDKPQLIDFLTIEAERQAESLIIEQLNENLPEGADQRDWNWQALTNWANRHFGLNLSIQELQKIARENAGDEGINRDGLQRYLYHRAKEAIARIDFKDLDLILSEPFPRQQLCGFLRHQYALEMTPDDFAAVETAPQAAQIIRDRVRSLYREREVRFPVAVAISRFLGSAATSTAKASSAGPTPASTLTFPTTTSRKSSATRSPACSKTAAANSSPTTTSRPPSTPTSIAPGSRNRVNPANGVTNTAALQELIQFANQEFEHALQLDDIEPLDREHVRQTVLQAYDRRYRPEFGHAERMLLLDVLDHSWKEHLYFMDHLRSTIGLASYAQKDPKVEYKREGMKAFESMWDGIGERVTAAIFRLETESPDFVGSLWSISNATHQTASSAIEEHRSSADPRAPGEDLPAVETIRNRDKKVRPNEPCPCGSGKKFKKCCGANG